MMRIDYLLFYVNNCFKKVCFEEIINNKYFYNKNKKKQL